MIIMVNSFNNTAFSYANCMVYAQHSLIQTHTCSRVTIISINSVRVMIMFGYQLSVNIIFYESILAVYSQLCALIPVVNNSTTNMNNQQSQSQKAHYAFF